MIESNQYRCVSKPYDQHDKKDIDALINFIIGQYQDHSMHPAMHNMIGSQPGGFMNIATIQRWSADNGEVAILYHNDNVIGMCCVENSEIHPQISIGGIRCWLDAKYRDKQLMSKYLLAKNLQWSIDKKKSAMMLTFNEYNKWLYDAVVRVSIGKSVSLGNIWSHWWKDCIPIPNKLIIRYTPQWCVLKPIDLEHSRILTSELSIQ